MSRLAVAAAALLLLAVVLETDAAAPAAATSLEIRVPETVKVEGEDAYICITKPLPDKSLKLVGIEPIAEQKVVHHILLYGCDEPFSKPKPGEEAVWECKHQPICGGRQDAVLYGWGRNAPKLELPPGVGYSVGKGSAIKWIVMQVHYLKEKPAGDNAGVRLSVQDTPVPYSAGLLSYASWFEIPPRKKQHFVLNNCCYRGFQPLHTFAVRVHTHGMGRRVFMNRAPAAGQGDGDIVALGDPLKPQGFYPVKTKTLWPGEQLTVGCEFDSSDVATTVVAGSDHNHEMCNMYLMVYSSLSHLEMCNDGSSMVDELAPGNMPHSAALLKDPYPLWKPPKPQDKLEKGGVVGNVASVTAGPDGTLWVLTRGGREWGADTFDSNEQMIETEPIQADVVMQLNPDTGKLLRQWGSGQFLMPHMISVDRNNTVWITDVGRHQALQFTASGKLLQEVGVEATPGHDTEHLCKPTQVASMNDGSILVGDGYCNSRVMRYNPDGSFHSEYSINPTGHPGHSGRKLSAAKDMAVVHSLVVDECSDDLVVADRENRAVHTFDLHTGQLKGTKDMSAHGKVWAVIKGPYGRTFALCWDEGKEARVVDVDQAGVHWAIPDSAKLWPHDMALGAAALPLSGAGERMLALYVAPLCPGCGPLEKYVLFPKDFGAPAADKAVQPMVLKPDQRPPLIHLGGVHKYKHNDPQQAGAAAAGGHHHQNHHEDVQHKEQQQQEDEKETEQEEQQEEQKAEAEEQQAEKKVVEEEFKDEQEEVKQLQDPKVLQELKQQLAELQKKLDQVTGGSAGSDTDGYVNFHAKPQRTESQKTLLGSWGATVLVVLLGSVMGCMVMYAYQKARFSQRSGPGYSRADTQERC